MEIMEEDKTARITTASPLIGPLDASAMNSSSAKIRSHSRVDMEGRDGDIAASGLDESEPLLSVTQRIKKKREGERGCDELYVNRCKQIIRAIPNMPQ